MKNDRFLSLASIVMVMAFVLLAAGFIFAASAPMRVASEGLTVEEQLAAQADLSNRLLSNLPANAVAVRIPFTADEAAAVDAAKSTVPLKIGVVKAVTPRLEFHGNAGLPTREGGVAWAAVFSSDNAGAIRLHVEDMSLPANTEMFLYSRNGQAYGPYTGAGPDGTGEFWTATIFGSEAILQVQAKSDLSGASFRIREAGVITPRYAGGFQDIAAPNANWPCGNPSCVEDYSCNHGSPQDTLSAAVAKMEWVQGAYIYTCTGGLISDTNPSQSNFFLTANHCVSKNNTAKKVNFYWHFVTSSCDGTCPTNGGAVQTSGATVAATGRKGDFTLLHLNNNPPGGSIFLGWTSSPVANSNGTKLYRVSNPNFGPQVYSQHTVDTSAPTCSSWPRGERIYSRDTFGAIDGGSSGSPIANSSAQIVGQLSGTCGTNPSDPCASGPGEANATVDGAFAFYFQTIKPIINP